MTLKHVRKERSVRRTMQSGKIRALWCLVYVVTILVLVIPSAQADPWPSYQAQTDVVNYVGVYSALSGGLWYYYMTVDANAIDPTFGDVVGIKALAVYPASGQPIPTSQIPADWTGYDTAYTRTNWDYDGGYEPNKGAFGYLTGGPTNYVPPDGQPYLIGAAEFPGTFTPGDQLFLVHVVCETDGTVNTFWARPGKGSAVPEPSSLLALAAAGIPTIGYFVRRRRNS